MSRTAELDKHAAQPKAVISARATHAPLAMPHSALLQNHRKFCPIPISFFFLSMNNANFNILGTSFNAIYEAPGCFTAVGCGPGRKS